MDNRNFKDWGFKPSAVIAGLNGWYEYDGFKPFTIELPDSKEGERKYHVFRTNPETAIDDAIKYLRSFDIFYTPDMKWDDVKWDDVKFKLNLRACLAEFGFGTVHDAWPKVNPAIDQIKARDGEIRYYILQRVDMNGIEIPESFRDQAASVENLIAYLFALLMQERRNKELAEEIRDRYCEKNAKLQKELDQWERWFKQKTKFMEED